MEAVLASVDVVVPCYNYAHYLKQCVNSVLRQAGVDVRVLILDDASPDDTEAVGTELARGDARVTYRRHAKNLGHISTYNDGIEWISGDYFLLLSADDYVLAGALGRAARLMDRAPEVGFVFGRAFMQGESARPVRVQPPIQAKLPDGELVLSSREFIKLAGARNVVPTPTAVVRTSLQQQVGGYRHELPHTGDMEMWLRLAARGPVGYVDADQAVYRQHSNNMSKDYSARMLPDIEQRKIAIEWFLSEHSHHLPDAGDLRETLLLDLARQAVARSSTAFYLGNVELSQRLLEVSRGLHPGIVNTADWWKLKLKRGIGTRAWRTVYDVKQALRPSFRDSA
jgi:glycosyltransferase involved in cell wall biosynthesis